MRGEASPEPETFPQVMPQLKLPGACQRGVVIVNDRKKPHLSGDITYCVEEAVLKVDSTPLLRTRLGLWLLHRGWWNVAILINCITCIFLFFAPLTKPVVLEAYDSDGELRSVARPHAIQSIAGSLLTIFGIFLLAHQMNRKMFIKCCLSFDAMVILVSGTMIQLVWHINWYLVFIRGDAWEATDIPQRILQFVATMCLYVPIATMDSITMRYSRKVGICWIIVIGFLAEFVLCRFGLRFNNFFADQTLDWWLISTTPDEIYLSSKLQLLLFLAKGAVAYSRGQPFSCIKADYCVPGRQVRVERYVRQLTDSITPTSCRSWTSMSSNCLEVINELGEDASVREHSDIELGQCNNQQMMGCSELVCSENVGKDIALDFHAAQFPQPLARQVSMDFPSLLTAHSVLDQDLKQMPTTALPVHIDRPISFCTDV